MDTQIALNGATNDIIKIKGGGIARISKGRYTIQLVKNKLLTNLGEWLLDSRKGWLNFKDYKKNPDLFNIEMRAREVILSVKGVQKIDKLSIILKDRVLYLTFTATTIYGGIDLTIPWRT